VIFRQVLHPATGCASYVFGCTGKGRLAVVDPHAEHVHEYLAIAGAAGAPIVAVLETHVQADHLSGAAELVGRTGAELMLHAAAGVDFPHRQLSDGEEIELGNDHIRVLHTPGHSPDSVCLLVGDRTRSDEPWLVLTGDTLFVGDAGRPDLERTDGAARVAAGDLYDSLRRLMSLSDHVEVYPSHFAGSSCGRSLSAKPSSTIGFERHHNPALQQASKAEFIEFMLGDLAPPPADHERIRAANRSG
jgi:hydroxyacylglutathione hydrolase